MEDVQYIFAFVQVAFMHADIQSDSDRIDCLFDSYLLYRIPYEINKRKRIIVFESLKNVVNICISKKNADTKTLI